jgi:hypothetical protein
MSRQSAALLVAVVAIAASGVAFIAGVAVGRTAPASVNGQPPDALPVQLTDPFAPPRQFQDLQPAPAPEPFLQPRPFRAPQPFQAPPGQTPPTLREFIPIPGPGDQNPGQRPQQEQGDCEPIILFYHNGQLYQLRPGEGPRDGQGRPGAPPEFYYLNPYQGPPIPGLPVPRPDQEPGFTPVNPRS